MHTPRWFQSVFTHVKWTREPRDEVRESLVFAWAGEMAQMIKCLFCKHRNLSLSPRAHIKKASHGGAHVQSQDHAGRAWWLPVAHWPTYLFSLMGSRLSEKFCLKTRYIMPEKWYLRLSSGIHICTLLCTLTHTPSNGSNATLLQWQEKAPTDGVEEKL